MRHVKIKPAILALSCSLLLVSCDNAKEELGLTRQAPDEFAVIRRAPLELPPDYSLRPPRPGAERPQEVSPELQAKQTVFGGKQNEPVTKPATSEEFLLQKTGGDKTREDIRVIVDQETASMDSNKEQPVSKRLLGFGFGGSDEDPATVVDADAEAARLRQNAEEGKAVTDGETPSIEE